jgi:hypothetical protein
MRNSSSKGKMRSNFRSFSCINSHVRIDKAAFFYKAGIAGLTVLVSDRAFRYCLCISKTCQYLLLMLEASRLQGAFC